MKKVCKLNSYEIKNSSLEYGSIKREGITTSKFLFE